MILPLEIRSTSVFSSNQNELIETKFMTTNIWAIQPSLPKQVDTLCIHWRGNVRQGSFSNVYYKMYLYRIESEYIQTRCSNSHTQVPPTGAGNPPTVLYWYIHSKRTIQKLELPHRNKYQTMDDLENDEVHYIDGSPYKTSQIGVMFPSHIIIFPETC